MDAFILKTPKKVMKLKKGIIGSFINDLPDHNDGNSCIYMGFLIQLEWIEIIRCTLILSVLSASPSSSQASTGLIRTRAAHGTPSRFTATSQQAERAASSPIRSLKGYVCTQASGRAGGHTRDMPGCWRIGCVGRQQRKSKHFRLFPASSLWLTEKSVGWRRSTWEKGYFSPHRGD